MFVRPSERFSDWRQWKETGHFPDSDTSPNAPSSEEEVNELKMKLQLLEDEVLRLRARLDGQE